MLEREFDDKKERVMDSGGLRLSINMPPSVAKKIRKTCVLLGDKRVSHIIRVLVEHGFTHIMGQMGIPEDEEDKMVTPLAERIAQADARIEALIERVAQTDARLARLETGRFPERKADASSAVQVVDGPSALDID